LLSLLTLTAGVARAQTTTTSTATLSIAFESSLPRVDASGKALNKRSLTLTPEAVSNQDCVDDQRIRFTLSMSGFAANAQVLAYAGINGQDCSAATQRAGSTSQCWPILRPAGAANLTNVGSTNIPLTLQQNIDIPVRAIMAGALTPQTPDYSASICGTVDLSNISVQFLYFDPGNTSQASVNHTVPITVDTIGPAAPTGLGHLPGNTRIQVNFASISGGDPDAGTSGGVTELTGVAIYCTPSTGTTDVSTTTDSDAGCTTVALDGGVDETGDAGDGGFATVCDDAGISTTTDGDAASSVCAAAVFTDPAAANDAGAAATTTTDDSGTAATTTTGIIPNAAFNAKYQCGSYSGNSGTSVIAEGLTNGVSYAVAVASTDKYGNVGPLSAIQCEIPEETTDFWEEYKAAGGLAGGCATVDEPFPLGTASAGLSLVVVAASFIRRRRNRR